MNNTTTNTTTNMTTNTTTNMTTNTIANKEPGWERPNPQLAEHVVRELRGVHHRDIT
jgi:hypothetical protein